MDPYSQQQPGHELPNTHQAPAQSPQFMVAPSPAANISQPAAQSISPSVANDLDLIEKEWVEKAKAIVIKTRTDPHTQNDEINKFKADYMKKRYGKDIKIEA